FRMSLLQQHGICCMMHLGNGLMEIAFGTCATVCFKTRMPHYRGTFLRLVRGPSLRHYNHFRTAQRYTPGNAGFANIPGSPIAYWATQQVHALFSQHPPLSSIAQPRKGNSTSNND